MSVKSFHPSKRSYTSVICRKNQKFTDSRSKDPIRGVLCNEKYVKIKDGQNLYKKTVSKQCRRKYIRFESAGSRNFTYFFDVFSKNMYGLLHRLLAVSVNIYFPLDGLILLHLNRKTSCLACAHSNSFLILL